MSKKDVLINYMKPQDINTKKQIQMFNAIERESGKIKSFPLEYSQKNITNMRAWRRGQKIKSIKKIMTAVPRKEKHHAVEDTSSHKVKEGVECNGKDFSQPSASENPERELEPPRKPS